MKKVSEAIDKEQKNIVRINLDEIKIKNIFPTFYVFLIIDCQLS